jgi:hypothetical protein
MADELRTLKEEDISTKLLTSQILPRHMDWFFVNEKELKDFETMDSESSQFLTVGIAALAVAVGLFGSSLTLAGAFTLPQLVMFYLTPGVVGALGILATWKGFADRGKASVKRLEDIARIRRESAVAVETTATRIIGDTDIRPLPNETKS